MRITRRGAAALLAPGLVARAAWAQARDDGADSLAAALLASRPGTRGRALDVIAARGGVDLVAPLIEILRFVPPADALRIAEVLEKLTGARHGLDWHAWMLFQEERPALRGFAGYAAWKADLLARIDPDFRIFIRADVPTAIRLEEVVWGGVGKDGIPALVDPVFTSLAEAGWLQDEEPVFGVALDGDVRAYPLRIMDWHEMADDVVGGVPVALAYCTLCGSGILFDRRVPGRAPFVFGSSGLLYRSNKLMYDQATHSLWNQFTGVPVVGPLTGSGIRLKVLPVVLTSAGEWRRRHPETRVLALATGHERDYRPGRPYGDYFARPELMFPALVRDDRLAAKEQVYVVRLGERERAWPLSAFDPPAVRNDMLGDLPIVLVGDARTRTVRAWRREDRTFAAGPEGTLTAAGARWSVGEDALVGPGGRRLERLPGHVAYWFAWRSFRPDGTTALP